MKEFERGKEGQEHGLTSEQELLAPQKAHPNGLSQSQLPQSFALLHQGGTSCRGRDTNVSALLGPCLTTALGPPGFPFQHPLRTKHGGRIDGHIGMADDRVILKKKARSAACSPRVQEKPNLIKWRPLSNYQLSFNVAILSGSVYL